MRRGEGAEETNRQNKSFHPTNDTKYDNNFILSIYIFRKKKEKQTHTYRRLINMS